jgi:hypothetical protein
VTGAEAVEVVTRAVAYWPAWARTMASEERLRLTARAWADFLSDVPKELVVEALKAYAAARHEWPPAVGVLRGAAMDLAHPETGPAEDVAWRAVVTAVARHGCWGEPTFADPIVARVVSAMGWDQLCASTNVMADRAHFLQMYRAAREAALARRDAPPSVRQLMAHRDRSAAEQIETAPAAAVDAPAPAAQPPGDSLAALRALRQSLPTLVKRAPEPHDDNRMAGGGTP